LLEKGYEVHGLVRGSTDRRFERLDPFADRLTLNPGDLLDDLARRRVAAVETG
jgi:GDP-D-mannose dehydratase